jgi:hypothetical protein
MTRRFAGCMALLVLLSACRDDKLLPSNETIIKDLQAEPASAPPQVQARPVLYLDTSASMRGFVHGTARSGVFIRTVNTIYRQAAQTYADHEMWGISATRTRLEHLSDIENEALYSGEDTPLSRIVSDLALRVREGKSALFISDLVQSEGFMDLRDLARAIMELASGSAPARNAAAAVDATPAQGNRISIALLAFRSAFDGNYFVETAPKGKFQVRLSGNGDDARPFYLLVAAPSSGAMEDLNRTILRDLKPEFVFSPTEIQIRIDSKKWSFPPGDAERHWDIFQHAAPAALIDKFVLEDCAASTCPLDLVFNANEQLGVKSEGDFAAQVARVPYAMGRASGKMTSAVWVPSIRRVPLATKDKLPAHLSYRITYPLPRPATNEWAAYRVIVSAGRGNLAQPEWVLRWSTHDDGNKENINQTLNLDAVVGTLIHEISEKAVFFDHMILVRRK